MIQTFLAANPLSFADSVAMASSAKLPASARDGLRRPGAGARTTPVGAILEKPNAFRNLAPKPARGDQGSSERASALDQRSRISWYSGRRAARHAARVSS